MDGIPRSDGLIGEVTGCAVKKVLEPLFRSFGLASRYEPACEGVAGNGSSRVQGLSEVIRSLRIAKTREEDGGSGGSGERGGDLGVGVVMASVWAVVTSLSRWRSFVAFHEVLGFHRGLSKWRCGDLKKDAEAEGKQGEESGLRKPMVGYHTGDVVLF